MSDFEQGEVRAEVIQELRLLAERGTDVAELVDHLLRRLDLHPGKALFPTLAHFRAAFHLSLREVLPLREWLGDKNRAEVDSILVPAMCRTKEQWQPKQLEKAGTG